MHSSVIGVPPVALANSVITQRLASWSKSTTGSPKPPFVQAGWFEPCQIVSIEAGPKTDAPVDLLKTWKPSLTIWTYCVRPTSPLVSGGAQLQLTPGKSIPSKLRIGLGIEFGKCLVCRAPSGLNVRL